MELRVGAEFEFTWRNDELTDPPGQRPQGFAAEHSMQSRITEVMPPTRLAITWGEHGAVSFDLAPRGDQVLLTIIHRRVPDRTMLLNVSAGWHTHLDVLAARLGGMQTGPFWDDWKRTKQDYDRRLPA